MMKPVTERNLGGQEPFVGARCPLCEEPSLVGYMKFLDPHGVERVDPDLFECTAKRHTYTTTNEGLRLLSENGKLIRGGRTYTAVDGQLVEQKTA